ncbi:TetR/AcrR family transcriptional regulator [Cohnella nanjingensis]|uniref:TetR/AcrR family transcriptional regulator n=1 Tax=Cohnella nanjingensis TaxID=1387779 RepID=A0A7X0RZ56_9BACL|nr:TetR/AcrR family transcriptional regulator [Cohnella nanjingensis]MBB6675000.1 TetR/AcrR family transcriptional regulator [Cohnella nanjingensis]
MAVRRERSDAAENRRLILQTAQALFAEHGVQAVSMHQIAKTAGVGQGTLYRCYAHKGELCSELAENLGRAYLKQLEDYLQLNRHLPARERIAGLIEQLIDFIDDKYEWLLPIHSLHACEDESAFFRSASYVFLMDHLTALFREIEAENAAEAGDPKGRPEGCDTYIEAHAVLCALHPSGYVHLREGRGYAKEQIKARYRKLIMH